MLVVCVWGGRAGVLPWGGKEATDKRSERGGCNQNKSPDAPDVPHLNFKKDPKREDEECTKRWGTGKMKIIKGMNASYPE